VWHLKHRVRSFKDAQHLFFVPLRSKFFKTIKTKPTGNLNTTDPTPENPLSEPGQTPGKESKGSFLH
jgi:hypothetical protein